MITRIPTITPASIPMNIEFLLIPALAGIGLALAAGPLGAFVIWRRMAYFSDATAHAAVLGVALALAFQVSIFVGVAVMALAMAMALNALSRPGAATDANLGVLAHSALALGLVAITFVPGARGDLTGFLFGEILAVSTGELVLIWLGAAAILGLLAWRWQGLVTSTVSEELAVSEGLSPARERLVLTIALALVVAVGLKAVGALLIGAILVIPAAAARSLARSPEAMAALASAVAVLSVVLGLAGSLVFDTPTGPSIVVAAATFFGLSRLVPQR